MRMQLALSLAVVSVLSAFTVLASLPAAVPRSRAASVDLDVGLGRPVLLANQKNRVHMRVSLRGHPTEAPTQRPPVNVCIAIDKSSSMTAGGKMPQARLGATQALRRLAPADTVSVVAYDSTVRVVVPAGSAGRRKLMEQAIGQLAPGGSTALFGGVVKCAEELRKSLDRDRVNRIILLSDGQANVGPSSPSELGALGGDLMAEGISVATVGLGLDYNEDLMAELAMRSDGRHTFVEHAADLARFLDEEMGSVTAVVARDVVVKVRVAPGARPLGILGRPADIVGDTITAAFGKIYAGRQHLFVLEMEVDPVRAAALGRGPVPLADVEVSFRDLISKRAASRSARSAARFSTSPADVDKSLDNQVMAEVAMLMAGETSARAVKLRDQGDVKAAEELLQRNAAQLEADARRYKDQRLLERRDQVKRQADDVRTRPQEWTKQRKQFKKTISDDSLEGMKL